MVQKLQVVTHVLLVFSAFESCSQAVLLIWKSLFTDLAQADRFFFSCVCEGTRARSIFLWCRCHARYMDLLIMLMWAVRSSRDVLGGSAASQQVFLPWPSVAALVAAFRRKNKKRFLFFFSSVANTTDACFPFVFLFLLFVKKYFLKTEGCHQAIYYLELCL